MGWFFSSLYGEMQVLLLSFGAAPFLPRDPPSDIKEIVRNLLEIKLSKKGRKCLREQCLKFVLPSKAAVYLCSS